MPELLGLMVSYLILALTFGSLLAAGMPILSSLIGVGVTLSGDHPHASKVATVSSRRPDPGGDAGDGGRHRLRPLHPVPPSTPPGRGTLGPPRRCSRALATAGSAVVFAGTTVVIALTGLMVAGIPVLTVMGLAAAGSVTMAVSVALTLLPAMALLLGERLRPEAAEGRRDRRAARAEAKAAAAPSLRRPAVKWVAAGTGTPC